MEAESNLPNRHKTPGKVSQAFEWSDHFGAVLTVSQKTVIENLYRESKPQEFRVRC